MTQHCSDNKADRDIGEYWERQFCTMAAGYGLMFTPLQWNKTSSAVAAQRTPHGWHVLTLPDIAIWTAPGQHHEIKHKSPTANGNYGLEVYRFNALLDFAAESGQAVMYTIHSHDLSGGREVRRNDIAHWLTVNVFDLVEKQSATYDGPSWVNGIRKIVPIHYWHRSLWMSLADYWGQTITQTSEWCADDRTYTDKRQAVEGW